MTLLLSHTPAQPDLDTHWLTTAWRVKALSVPPGPNGSMLHCRSAHLLQPALTHSAAASLANSPCRYIPTSDLAVPFAGTPLPALCVAHFLTSSRPLFTAPSSGPLPLTTPFHSRPFPLTALTTSHMSVHLFIVCPHPTMDHKLHEGTRVSPEPGAAWHTTHVPGVFAESINAVLLQLRDFSEPPFLHL